jgi:starvation-inducible DNA-binding protein
MATKSQEAPRAALRPTKNDIPSAQRAQIVQVLNQLLSDAIDLQTQCKQAHWNVKGATFIALHELFDKVNEAVEDYVDDIAERAVQLGGIVEGTARSVAGRTRLPEYPLDIADVADHVDALSTALASFGKVVRADIDEVDSLGDKDSADVLTEVSRGIDKWLWFVESHNG